MNNCAAICSCQGHNPDIYWFEDLRRPFPPHTHDRTLVGCLAQGLRQLCLPGGNVAVSEGTLVILPPFTTHGCKPLGDGPASWLAAQCPADLLCPQRPLFLQDKGLCADLQKAVLASRAANDFAPILAFLHSLRKLVEEQPAREPKTAPASKFLAIFNPQSIYLNDKIRLDDLAACQKQAKFTFLRAFRKAMGITPCRFLQSLRIANAQKLMRLGLSLPQCAADSGFYDQAHFNRAFKASIGMTPGQWRNALAGGKP